MTETDADAERSILVPGTHRLIRVVDGKEGPFAGALVAHGDAVAVCVDLDELSGWPGWGFSDAEHVCGVLDVRRRADGHDALLPWCIQRVEAFLGRRRAAGAELTAGELGTLVVSLLRGIRELGDDADAVGDWWLSGDGRPLFVLGKGGAARAGTAALIDRVSEHTADRAILRILDEVVAALRRPRHHAQDDERWEEQLFALAAPRALRLDVFAPERAGDVVPQRLGPFLEAQRGGELRRDRLRVRKDPAPHALSTLLPTVRAGASALISRLRPVRAVDGSRRPGPPSGAGGRPEVEQRSTAPPRRRRPLMLAGALGAVVLVVGLSWPGGEEAGEASVKTLAGDQSAGRSENTAQPIGPDADADTAAEPKVDAEPEAAPVEADALGSVPGLLDAISACVAEGDAVCAAAVIDGATGSMAGLVAQGCGASAASLVDDYGDVAVVKLAATAPDAAAEPEQMLVLERRDEEWLVRDVYDVAHQPD